MESLDLIEKHLFIYCTILYLTTIYSFSIGVFLNVRRYLTLFSFIRKIPILLSHPIILLIVSEVFEKIVLNSCMRFQKEEKILNLFQFKCSNEDAFLSMTRDWAFFTECGNFVSTVFFDLIKVLILFHILDPFIHYNRLNF